MRIDFSIWILIIGLILAAVVDVIGVYGGLEFLFTYYGVIFGVFFLLGIFVGYFNTKEREITSFLRAIIVLLIIGLVGETTFGLLDNFSVFLSGVGLIVALEQIFKSSKLI